MFYKEANLQETAIGEIPKSWQIGKLEDYAYVKGRIGWRGLKASEYREKGPFLIANKHIKDHKIIWDSCDHLSEFRYEESPEIQLRINDVIISKDGTIGEAAIVENLPDRASINSTMMLLRVTKDTLSPRFLFYFLQSSFFRKFVKQKVAGTSIPHLFQRDMKNLNIIVPAKEEQEAVSEVLSVVDLAIQRTDEVIAKTERLKKGLMQELLTKGIGHKEFKDTPIGKIPRTWEVVSLREVATIERGKFAHRPRNEPRFYGGNIPFIQTGDIANANGLIRNYVQTLNEEGLRISRMFKKGTIVISIAGNIGDVGILGFDACFPDSVIGITSHSNVNSLFLMWTLQNRKNEISGKAPRSTQKNINLQILESLKIPLPSLSEQEKIADILSTINEKLELEKNEKSKLERVKQGLMDLLLTGKVRVAVD